RNGIALFASTGRAILFPTKRIEPDFCAGGRRSGKQCSDTNGFVARNCREATRSAESRRMNTTEINAANLNNAVLVSQAGHSTGTRISRPFSSKQLTRG